jgi:hypothetical protein
MTPATGIHNVDRDNTLTIQRVFDFPREARVRRMDQRRAPDAMVCAQRMHYTSSASIFAPAAASTDVFGVQRSNAGLSGHTWRSHR